MSTHTRFSPSGAHRWMRCPGSINFDGGGSYAADEGTAAHTLASDGLCGQYDHPLEHAGRIIKAGNNAFEVDEDMAEAVAVHVDYCRALMEMSVEHGIEKRVDLSEVLGVPDQAGTADFWAVIGKNLIVVDFKYGMGLQVDAAKNEQLQLYALGVYHELELLYEIDTVTVVVVQPRKQHHSEWTLTVDELKAFGEEVRMKAQLIADAEDPAKLPQVAGEKQCHFCTGKTTCAAFREVILDALDTPAIAEFEAAPPAVEKLPAILPKLNLIKKWCGDVVDLARARVAAGEDVGGYKLVAGKKGRRFWVDPDAVQALLEKLRLRKDEIFNMKLISPAQAEKKFKDRPRTWGDLAALYDQKDGAPTLAPPDDPRPALVLTNAADDFHPVNEDGDFS